MQNHVCQVKSYAVRFNEYMTIYCFFEFLWYNCNMEKKELEKLKEQANKGLFEVGDAIKQMRTQKGWSMSELAKQSHVSPSVVSDLENHKGIMPNVFTLLCLAKALELPENALLEMIVNKTFNTIKDENTDKISQITRLMIDCGLPPACVDRVIDYMNHFVSMSNIYNQMHRARLIYNTEKNNGTKAEKICISSDMVDFIDKNMFEIGRFLNK